MNILLLFFVINFIINISNFIMIIYILNNKLIFKKNFSNTCNKNNLKLDDINNEIIDNTINSCYTKYR